MNATQIKSFLALTVLAIIGFGPLSLTCLIGMFIVVRRPKWFYQVVDDLYRGIACGPADCSSETTTVRVKCFLCLAILLVLDIAPVPVTGSIGLYVVATRPCWFKTLVEKIYK